MASKNTELKLLDKRTLQNNIKLGFIKEEDVKKHLQTLPDETGNFDELAIEDEVLEDDIDDIIDELPEESETIE